MLTKVLAREIKMRVFLEKTPVVEPSCGVWPIAFDIDADWRRPSNEIIDEVSRRAARKFPYRNR